MRSNNERWPVLLALAVILAACAGAPPGDHSCRIAVWELENLGPAGAPEAEMGPLLTANVLESFQKTLPCGIVERQKLDLALSELALGASQLAAEDTRLRVGHIAGARQMVFGAYQIIGPNLRIDLRLVDVATGAVVQTAETSVASRDRHEWLRAARGAAEQLADTWRP